MLWVAALLAVAPIADAAERLGPFVEHEAESSPYHGTLLGPSRDFSSLPSEASGRRAVQLRADGDYVEFVLTEPANAVTVRYAIPDSADGSGRDGWLQLTANGHDLSSLPVTSRYAWYYGAYPFTNRPADGLAHHFYDHSRMMFGRTLPAGSRVRLAIRGRSVPWVAVDLADFELVPPPAPPPADALAITIFGADPTGKRDSRASLVRALQAGRRAGRPVWIPPGRFRIDGHVEVDRVRLLGAGAWHSVLRGKGIGLYGKTRGGGSTRVELRDFAVIGDVRERNDRAQLAGIGGTIGGGSTIANLFLQHHKVGVWLDGPLRGVRIAGLRIYDQAADGLNLRRGVSDVVVERNIVRNTGDDGLASWSQGQANHDLTFRDNWVVAPVLANGIAIYGGRDITISGNLVADTVTQGGGLHVGNRFGAVPLSGRILLEGNRIIRGGSFDPNWRFGVGALWFYALDAPIDADIVVRNLELDDSAFAAIHVIGKPVRDVNFDRLRVRGGDHLLQLQGDGHASFRNLSVAGLRRSWIDRRSGDFVVEGLPAAATR